MARHVVPRVDSQRGSRLLLGFFASIAAVAAVTGVVYLFRSSVPVLSLGVLYLFAVLPIAVVWGRGFSIPVALASMLAFNFFFLPPVHTFTLIDERDWFALTVYLATAIVVSDLASRARRRAAEAEQREREETLLAELSIALLQGEEIGTQLDRIAAAAAAVLGVPRARLELARAASPPAPPRSSCGRTGGWSGRSPSMKRPTSPPPSAGASCRRSPHSSPSRWTGSSSSGRRSRPRRFGLATPSRRRSCGR
jgi:Domain of unknown function (DUF4118)